MYNLYLVNKQCIYIAGNIEPYWAIDEGDQISIPVGVSSPQVTQVGTFNHVVFKVVGRSAIVDFTRHSFAIEERVKDEMYTVEQETVRDAIATSEKIVEKHYMEKVSATLVHKVGAISSAVI